MQKHQSHLAIDLGASNGRHILGKLVANKLVLKEVYRFPNEAQKGQQYWTWNLDNLLQNIKTGIHKALADNPEITTLSIDSWGVDYVLLDAEDRVITPTFAYRNYDSGREMAEFFKNYSKKWLYNRTGIQFLTFNTLFRLYCLPPEIKKKARTILLIPDYFHYCLTGQKTNEYTNATTTQIVNFNTQNWDEELLKIIGFRPGTFQKMITPGTVIGRITPELEKEFGKSLTVIAAPTHDTGSAFVVANSALQNSINISSGTWSLIGIETPKPIVNEQSLAANFSNEGGINYQYRFLKNQMGLWIFQELQRQNNLSKNFAELVQTAQESTCKALVNVDDQRFFKPPDVKGLIRKMCAETKQKEPQTNGDFIRCVLQSTAQGYARIFTQIDELTQQSHPVVQVFGGGSQNVFLNQLVADCSNRTIWTGPVEATAIGNLITQLISTGEIPNLDTGRKIIASSFELKKYEPKKE